MSKFFQKSEEIGIELNKFLLEYYQNIKTPVFDEIENGNFIYKLYQDYFINRKLKVKKGHYRANLVYIAAKILLGKNNSIQELLPCMAAVELCMWSAYTYNWIIDNKNINSQNPKKRLSDLVVIGYLMHDDILKLDLKSETKIYIFTEWFQNIGLAYAAENYTRITDFENISDSQFWKMDNFVGAMSNGVLNQICFKIVELEFGTNNLDLFNGNYAKFKKIFHQNGLHLQSINNLSDFIIPNKYLTTSEKIAGEDYMKDKISDRMTEPIFKMLKIAKKEDPGLYVDILNAAKTLKYPDTEFPNRVHDFLKQHAIVKEIILWLKSEKKRILKEIKQIEKGFDLENIDIKEGFDLWKESTVIMTNNKFIKQLKIDYELEI